jgi:hypothetical protein
MAKIVTTEYNTVNTSPWLGWGRVVAFGAVAGLAVWVFTALIARYIIEPLACGQAINADVCLAATPIAGNIATILITPLAIVGMVRLGVIRPIIIALATAALLWPLAAWAEGLFWLEAIAWFVALYALAYGLFAWIVRSTLLWVAIVLSLVAVLAIRLTIFL